MPDKATIKIPKILYESLKKQIEGTGFSSVTDFIVYVMRDIAASGNVREDASFTKKEILQIRARLKKLGYI
ncbi:MAG: CopG family transcriptional regulator [Candidatus Omnitrophica bacterium]|nr:CopG family transcriptional regulator [Candidatus Omnitrophota bacterium]MBD3269515.1 CopG family transcriptional regulator [Candidatus Omnitrophota bacterium]